jgi:RNA polymerase sigma-70 factor (ECF subfamily)
MDTTRVSLLIRIKDRRNDRAWADFDAIYRPMLLRFATSRGLDEGDAEDVVQHCMAAVHKHIEQFDYDPDKGRFRGWLRTVVNNHVRSLLKKRHDPIADSQELEQLQDREPLPEVVFDRMWMEEHLKHCLRRIRAEVDEETFTAFQHYVIDEWNADRVCETLNISRNKLYKIKWRVTERLREKMQRLIDGEKSVS